jgi:hypothetical protein
LRIRSPFWIKVFQFLNSDGRVMVVEPTRTERGELLPAVVDDELRRRGFDIVSRDDQFIGQLDSGPSWLVTARKP